MKKRVYAPQGSVLKKRKTTSTAVTKPKVPRPYSFGKIVGFPRQLNVKLRYFEPISLASDTGSLATYSFRANGLYDPNHTGTGHQPMYYDQLVALYNHWVVTGSKITLRVSTNSSATACGTFVVYLNDDSTITSSDIVGMAEQATAKSGMIGMVQNDHASTFVSTYSAEKVFGPNPVSNSNLRGAASSDPAEESYYALGWQASVLGASNVFVNVEIEYQVTFFELKDITKS